MRIIKKVAKPIIINSVGHLCGIFCNILNSAITVFVFHDVSDKPSEFSRTYNLNVPPKIFEYQIEFIKKNFNIIGPSDLLQGGVPPRAALITFDDGFQGYFRNAVPVLEKHRVPSIIFLNMGPIKGDIFWAGLITYLCDKSKDFRSYIETSLTKDAVKKPLYLSCSKELVESYMNKTGELFEDDVNRFVGEFAKEKDLIEASTNSLVFYGNHLFNHYVPLLLSDADLLDAYNKNANALEKYDNYIDMLSLPFGQPLTCFSKKQLVLLLHNGAKRVFISSGLMNYDVSSRCLVILYLTSFDDSPSKIWFRVFQKKLRESLLSGDKKASQV